MCVCECVSVNVCVCVCVCVCVEQVIFDVSTVYNQFPWHLSEQVALDMSVFIPGRQVVTGQINFMEVR